MELRERVEAIVGQQVVGLEEIPGAGGYTPALRRIATLADGTTVFVKAAVNELTAGWLQAEQRAYTALGDASFLPRLVGGDDEVLVLEDLRGAHWPPPWRDGDLDLALATLADAAAHTPPDDLPDLEATAGYQLRLWQKVAARPEPFLGLGLCTRD